VGKELNGPEHLVEHVTGQLVNDGLLRFKNHGFFDGIALALAFGKQSAREQWRASNNTCRRILKTAVAGYENPKVWSGLEFNTEKCEPPIDAPFEQLAAATRILEYLGYITLEQASSKSHFLKLTEPGYDLARDDEALRRVFPVTATEDEEAHTQIAPDVLAELITSSEQLLSDRGWTAALDELKAGDARHRDRLWTEAVREYYSAVESGLRYRIHDAGETVDEKASMKRLASRAAECGLIPVNYSALFGYIDSIRSPRSHGAALQVVAVEVGPAESLLMGHLARALLTYLGQRP
jgi:hypothetical protein